MPMYPHPYPPTLILSYSSTLLPSYPLTLLPSDPPTLLPTYRPLNPLTCLPDYPLILTLSCAPSSSSSERELGDSPPSSSLLMVRAVLSLPLSRSAHLSLRSPPLSLRSPLAPPTSRSVPYFIRLPCSLPFPSHLSSLMRLRPLDAASLRSRR